MEPTVKELRVDGIPVKVFRCHCGVIPTDQEVADAVRDEVNRTSVRLCAICGKPFITLEAGMYHRRNGEGWTVDLQAETKTWDFTICGGLMEMRCHLNCIHVAFPHMDEDNKAELKRRQGC